MFPLAPNVKTDKTVFLEEDAGIIHADRYMQCILEHLRKQKNMKIMENTSVNSICNQAGGVILELKTKKDTRMIFANKVALTCGRWMTKLVPALKTILKPVRQLVSYWEMKDHEKYKVGRYPAWSHKKQNLGIYCLPDSSGEGLKYAIHDENPLAGQDITERGYIKHKMEELMENMD